MIREIGHTGVGIDSTKLTWKGAVSIFLFICTRGKKTIWTADGVKALVVLDPNKARSALGPKEPDKNRRRKPK